MLNRLRLNVKKYRLGNILLVLVALFGFGLMISLCMRSEGLTNHDEISHFMIARKAWVLPRLALDLWGRPLNTMAYMLPALHSWLAARFTSIMMSFTAFVLALKTGQKMGMKNYLFLIPVLLIFQPWFLSQGFTTMTEVPFCLALIAGVYFWVSDQYDFASLSFGALPLIRHEGIALLAAWCFWMLLKKNWKSLVAAGTPYCIYNVLYWPVYGKPAFLIFMNCKPTDFYGSGAWSHFVKPTLKDTGVLPVVLSWLAIPAAVRLREKGMVFLMYSLYFIVHTVIYRFGLYASGGYYLFLMPISVGFGIAASLGTENLLNALGEVGEKFHLKWLAVTVQAAIILVIFGMMLNSAMKVSPFQLTQLEMTLRNISNDLAAEGIPSEKIYSTHVYFQYLKDLDYSNWLFGVDIPYVENLEAGSIILWDRHYTDRWGITYEWLTSSASPYRIKQKYHQDYFVLFEKKATP